MQITISIPDQAFTKISEYREKKYPHLKKESRMMLQIVMDKVNEEQDK